MVKPRVTATDFTVDPLSVNLDSFILAPNKIGLHTQVINLVEALRAHRNMVNDWKVTSSEWHRAHNALKDKLTKSHNATCLLQDRIEQQAWELVNCRITLQAAQQEVDRLTSLIQDYEGDDEEVDENSGLDDGMVEYTLEQQSTQGQWLTDEDDDYPELTDIKVDPYATNWQWFKTTLSGIVGLN